MNSTENPAVAGPVERVVRPRNEWEHLMAYGYAPGHYMNTCHVCKQTVMDVDKRAITCRPCAEAKHAARDFTPAELVLMNELDRSKPGICGA